MGLYPTNKELKIIEKWDLIEGDDGRHDKLYALIDYVRNLWSYPDRFRISRTRKSGIYIKKKVRTLYMSTGGWSGNESLIDALGKNFLFWSMFWWKSQRGGHFWFEIPPQIERKAEGEK